MKKNTDRKESELECFKRIKPPEIPLSLGLYPDRLFKTLSSPDSIEFDRVIARVLQNPLIQKTLVALKEKYGVERIETFLESNEKNIKKGEQKRLTNQQNPSSAKKRKTEEKTVKDSKSSENEDKPVKKAKKTKPSTNSKEKKKGSKKGCTEEKIDTDDQPAVEANKTLDPFFVSTSGQGYLATAMDALSDDNDSGAEHRTKKPIQRNVQKPMRGEFKRNEPNYRKPVQSRHIEVAQKEEEELHPSWKAKQQMKKLQIQEFKGTKIKFDD
jgi:hypothetical protein